MSAPTGPIQRQPSEYAWRLATLAATLEAGDRATTTDCDNLADPRSYVDRAADLLLAAIAFEVRMAEIEHRTAWSVPK